MGEKGKKKNAEKISLPLEKLNSLIGGGIEKGSNVLILADLVINKMQFGSSIINYRLEQDDHILYLVNNKIPEYAKDHIKDYKDRNESISFIDGFSSTLGKSPEEIEGDYFVEAKITDEKEEYVESTRKAVEDALEDLDSEKNTLVFDSLDSWIGEMEELQKFVKNTRKRLRDTGTTAYYLLPNLGFEEEDEDTFQRLRDTFDYLIHLKGLERTGIVLKYIDIRKPEIETKIPFDITVQGLATYIPKILVTGPENAGKSTTVQNMSDKAVSVDRLGTTVALDHGEIEREGIKTYLFGTPGQERFDWAIDFLGRSIYGCFILLDSRDPDYERAKVMLDELQEKEIPTIVLANFQNKEGAISPEEIEEEMGIKTIGVDAMHGENLELALDTMFDEIISRHFWYYT
ncbi:MAG: GTPase [Candidatus Nanohaloarchaea archaeon]|nr:GTPase [Candidatus Nanohaloarchaea archaeon]